MEKNEVFIYDAWYLALPGKDLKKGAFVKKQMLNQPFLIGRDKAGSVFALKDLCPHRGMPLSYGRFDGSIIQCCYHGWCFDTHGVCTDIPALTEFDRVKVHNITVTSYPVREANGNIWVFIPDPQGRKSDPTPFPFGIDFIEDFFPIETLRLPCNIDHANFGLLDPSHVTYVHQSWWWRSPKTKRMKRKAFENCPLGFRMVSHEPSSNSRLMALLGKEVTTEITFQLPGVRTEVIKNERMSIVSMTTHTPIDESTTELNHFFYLPRNSFLKYLKPIIKYLGRKFLQQDFRNFTKQAYGLRYDPRVILVGEVDRQTEWYFSLKKSYQSTQNKAEVFGNIDKNVLHWYT